VWRLVGGKDAYLGCYRVGMGLYKISIHPKDTLFGFTRQSAAKFGSGSRIDKAWPRPQEFHPGWTRGPAVLVPRTSLGARDLSDEDLGAPIAWVPAPGEGEFVTFTIVLEAPGGAPDGEIMEPHHVVLGSVVERRSGGNVWVLAGRQATTSDFQRTCERLLANPTNQFHMRPKPECPPGTFLWLHRNDVQPMWIDLPLPTR